MKRILALFLGLVMLTTQLPVYASTEETTIVKNADIEKIEGFVTRLYEVCLSRTPDEAGLAYWSEQLAGGTITGIEAAYGFVFSSEFKGKNLCDKDYTEQLYHAMMGRESDASGKATWVYYLSEGTTREEVFNGFAGSEEFKGICEDYGIVCGSPMPVSEYGTVPTGACCICGKEDKVVSFIARMYKVCLNREPEPAGLASWSTALREEQETGCSVAYGFIFSPEFVEKNYDNATYVEHLYEAFMGRSSDPEGKAGWVAQLENGTSRVDVFFGFVNSQEFIELCNSYGILPGGNHTHEYYWDGDETTRTRKCTGCNYVGVIEICQNGAWGYFDEENAKELFEHVNCARNSTWVGLVDDWGNPAGGKYVDSLIEDSSLTDKARKRAVEAAINFDHGSNTDECLAWGYGNATEAYHAWCYSYSHARAMTYPNYVYGGIAWYWYDSDNSGENLTPIAVLEMSK